MQKKLLEAHLKEIHKQKTCLLHGIEDRSITVPRSTTAVVPTVDSSPQRETLEYDKGGQTHDIMTLEVRDMDITAPDHDIYHGVYPDFQLPLPNRPCT